MPAPTTSLGAVQVRIPPQSDGNAAHVPKTSQFTIVDPPILYLEKLATLWMEKQGQAKPGYRYFLDRLPAGYTVWMKPRAKYAGVGPRSDQWLYGHPEHKTFDSPNRFFPHFLHLMQNGGNNIGCECNVCHKPPRPYKPGQPSVPDQEPVPSRFQHFQYQAQHPSTNQQAVTRPPGRPPKTPQVAQFDYVDQEGTPDVYRNLIERLRGRGSLDVPIEEPMSMDWRAERSLLIDHLDHMLDKPSWQPRAGEVVMLVRQMDSTDSIRLEEQVYTLFNTATQTASPIFWEAGVVTQTPVESRILHNLESQSPEHVNVNYSGFRVELLPEPNGKNKSLSHRYKYVGLWQIRPFVFWKELLQGVPEESWSPTIKHALSIMSSFSLVHKYRFRGTWPTAAVFCSGMYIGSEFIALGDVVRIMPSEDNAGSSLTVTSVMLVKSIQLTLTKLDQASSNDYDDGHPYNSSVRIGGLVYSMHAKEGKSKEHIVSSKLSRPILDYGDWSMVHGSQQQMEIPFHRVLGRCYDKYTIQLWFPQVASLDLLSIGLEGSREARAYSTNADGRIREGKNWYWGDSRVEALDITTVNGTEVGKHDPDRNTKEWRKFIKIMEGIAGEEEKQAIKLSQLQSRPLRGYGVTKVSVNPPGAGSETDGSGLKRSRDTLDMDMDVDEDVVMEEDSNSDGQNVSLAR